MVFAGVLFKPLVFVYGRLFVYGRRFSNRHWIGEIAFSYWHVKGNFEEDAKPVAPPMLLLDREF